MRAWYCVAGLLVVTCAVFAADNSSVREGASASAVAVSPAELQIAERDALDEKLRALLSAPVSVEFSATPLSEVLSRLQAEHGVNVVPDWEQILNQEDVEPTTPISITLNDVPLEFALDHILNIPKLAWGVKGNVVVVTSKQAARDDSGFSICRAYDVHDLLRVKMEGDRAVPDFETLSQMIALSVPGRWDDSAGDFIMPFEVEDKYYALIVRHNFRAHMEIERLLTSIRAAGVKRK